MKEKKKLVVMAVIAMLCSGIVSIIGVVVVIQNGEGIATATFAFSAVVSFSGIVVAVMSLLNGHRS